MYFRVYRCASGPKRLRHFLKRDGAVLNMALCIFLRAIAQSLQSSSLGAAQVDKAVLHIGAVAFIHRFGSSLNEHVYFRVCVVDGVFEELAGSTDADLKSSSASVIFHPASGVDETAVAKVQVEPATTGDGVPAVAPLGHSLLTAPKPAPPKRAPAHYLWAVLIARIYEVFPPLCSMCGGQIRIIAFIMYSADIRKILDHIGVDV